MILTSDFNDIIFKGGQLRPVWPEKENLWREFIQTGLEPWHDDLLVRYGDCPSTEVMETAKKSLGYGTAQVLWRFMDFVVCFEVRSGLL